MLIKRAVVALLACVVVGVAMAGNALELLRGGSLDGWTTRSFAGNTHYHPVMIDGVPALRARADASASALYREGRVRLNEWPTLHWRWRVQASAPVVNERSREGDDFAARVYVIAAHPLFLWKTQSICYVWASGVKTGQTWPNPYAGNVRMIAVNGRGDATGEWVEHQRDVAADFKLHFGEAPQEIVAVALMTDTDQSGGSVTAWYAAIRFEGH